MTTLIAIVAGLATFLLTQFIGAVVLAILGTSVRPLGMFLSLEPWKTIMRLLLWGSCIWLGMIVFGLIA